MSRYTSNNTVTINDITPGLIVAVINNANQQVYPDIQYNNYNSATITAYYPNGVTDTSWTIYKYLFNNVETEINNIGDGYFVKDNINYEFISQYNGNVIYGIESVYQIHITFENYRYEIKGVDMTSASSHGTVLGYTDGDLHNITWVKSGWSWHE